MEGKFDRYGGQFVPEILMPAIEELIEGYEMYRKDQGFKKELDFYLREFAGRPTPLYNARRISKEYGVKIYLKREDLVHGGAHKLNNTLGQALLAKYMGKSRIIAETGAGQHGTATAIAGAMLGLKTEVYMGAKDIERQKMNVYRMKLMGTNVIPVETGSKTLKDAINEALRDWVANVKDTYYLIGSVVGPHPYPTIVRDLQSIIGTETKEQILKFEGRLPDSIVACTGGGSNSIGIFHPFIDEDVNLFAIEAGGEGLKKTENTAYHSASLCEGEEGILHGARTKILQNQDGQILESHSIAAGLDYSGVGPELAYLSEIGRLKNASISDKEALDGFHKLSRYEGIIPALESAHAVAYALKRCDELGDLVVINISGRGDKDVDSVSRLEGALP
ncbi:MAG: tryptophan synthase subunit beta [Halobacteriota archaeon]|nr:tryptophan synthase subunit beta [Halobacteriota archaeon]